MNCLFKQKINKETTVKWDSKPNGPKRDLWTIPSGSS